MALEPWIEGAIIDKVGRVATVSIRKIPAIGELRDLLHRRGKIDGDAFEGIRDRTGLGVTPPWDGSGR